MRVADPTEKLLKNARKFFQGRGKFHNGNFHQEKFRPMLTRRDEGDRSYWKGVFLLHSGRRSHSVLVFVVQC